MLASVLVGIVLVGIVAAIIYFKAKARKLGKSSCGCGCADCPSNCACHPKETT